MTPKEVLQMIEREIGGDWSISNWHACDLKKCLVRPKKRKIIFGGETREAWIVLEEDPINLNKFKVFYNERTNKYGLVEHSEPFGYAVNSHDTFLDAFKSM